MIRRDKALRMRLDGYTYGEIGVQLGISRQRAQQLISPSADIRDAVIHRANGRCQGCGLRVNKMGHVHHKATTGMGCDAYHDVDNLELLCIGCHREKHSSHQNCPRCNR